MSQPSEKRPRQKSKNNRDFWRAASFLGRYRGRVIVSIITAFIAGTVMTSGIATIMPIIKLLVDRNQTVPQWIDESLASLKTNSHFGALVEPRLKFISTLAHLLPSNQVAVVAILFSVVAAIGFVGNVARYVYEFQSDKCAIDAINDIRRKLYNHALHMPLAFFGLRGTSDLTSRLVQDCQQLQEGFTILLGQTTLELFRAFLALAAAMIIDWRLTMFIIAFCPITFSVIKKFGKRMRRASRAALQNSATMLGQVESSLHGIRVVKASNAERFERRRYNRITSGLRNEQVKLAHYDALSTPTLETMATFAIGGVLIFATYLMFGHVKHPLGKYSFFGIMACLIQIGEALRRVSKLNTVIQKSNAAATRVFEAIDVPIERPINYSTRNTRPMKNIAPIGEEVRFEHLSFSYPGNSALALDDVSLTVKKGQSTAIVGRNGSGKTTLMALLPRFYDPISGRVLIDGVDVRDVTLRSLRKQISVVTQESVIFPGTIADNIAYGLPRATRAEIEDAAKRAFAHDFILQKPNAYDTSLDGLGGQLSGGQRQRLNIARAILRKTPILILDEATSQVDAESEHLIQQAIESLMHERTTFVIAHRFSTILSADTIIVMDQGKIVGAGKHEELLTTCNAYKSLYERQIAPGQPHSG